MRSPPDDTRKRSALEAILQQVARLDALLRDLLEMTQRATRNSRMSSCPRSYAIRSKPIASWRRGKVLRSKLELELAQSVTPF